MAVVVGVVALAAIPLGIWQARVEARRQREHLRELDAIAEQRRRDEKRFFSPAERAEIDRAAKRLNETGDRH